MNTTLIKLIGAALIGISATSCTTNYDAYGNPSQGVDPLGAAAVAGVAGYAIGQNNGKKYYYGGHYYTQPYYGHGPRPPYWVAPKGPYYGKPGYVKPGYVKPGYVKPGYVKPGYVKPGYGKPVKINGKWVNPHP